MTPCLGFGLLSLLPNPAGPEQPQVPQEWIAGFSGDHAAAISYTFNDSLRDQFLIAVPTLHVAGFKETFLVIPGATAETVEESNERQHAPLFVDTPKATATTAVRDDQPLPLRTTDGVVRGQATPSPSPISIAWSPPEAR